jgi:hypothetical protein
MGKVFSNTLNVWLQRESEKREKGERECEEREIDEK